ncbi:hypothetical protein ACFRJ1_17900 [Streptomyces sp. NPDC056773]|uniref:hypothetical protein n=1 Tax=unclassified Streptomyces TaxID=2593676 RepID=UPI0036B0A555
MPEAGKRTLRTLVQTALAIAVLLPGVQALLPGRLRTEAPYDPTRRAPYAPDERA